MSILKKVIIKTKIKESNRKNRKRGAEVVETILMVGVSITLIVIVFFPQLQTIMTTAMTNLSSWFTRALGEVTPFI